MNLKKNTLQCSLLLYIILVLSLIYTKPKFLLNSDGSLKEFGTGNDKTVFPFWLCVLLLAMLSYYVCKGLSVM